MIVAEARSFNQYLLIPPYQDKQPEAFSDLASDWLIWQTAREVTDIADNGRALFTGTKARRTELWHEFRNYVRIAKDYYDGGRKIQGSSAALLYYYCFLNLAKAELLRVRPDDVSGQKKSYHGLVFDTPSSSSVFTDSLVIDNGVFSWLYHLRTGLHIKKGSSVKIADLLLNVPEVGYEVIKTGIGHSKVGPVYSLIATDYSEVWGQVLILGASPAFFAQQYAAEFDEVELFPNWKDAFAISRRSLPKPILLQTKWAIPSSVAGPNFAAKDIHTACQRLWSSLMPNIDATTQSGYDAYVTPPIGSDGNQVPMPVSLARYALMFYLSSVVRYKPQLLDPQSEGAAAWVMDSFATDSALHLLVNAISGIKGIPIGFSPGAGGGRY